MLDLIVVGIDHGNDVVYAKSELSPSTMIVGCIAHWPAILHKPFFDEISCPSGAREVRSVSATW